MSAGMSSSSGAGFQRAQRPQHQHPHETKQDLNTNHTSTQPPQKLEWPMHAGPSSASLAPAASAFSAAAAPSAPAAPALSREPSQSRLLAATPASVGSCSVASAPASPQPQHVLPSSHALSRRVAACNDDLSPSDDSGDEDANAAGGYLLSAEEVAATQKLHAAHEARGEEIAALHSQLREKQQQLDRLQSNLARIEKEQVDDNASCFATSEQLRSDLAHEIQKHSATKVQLAQRGNVLAALVRERDLLSSSLQSHERELASTHEVVRSLRERIGVLEEIQTGLERDAKFNGQEVGEAGESEESQSWIEGDEPPAASSLVPVLSSSSAPLHLRRSRLHALLLHRTISDRKLVRLESELAQQRRENQSHLQSIADQWSQLEQIRHEMHKLQEERDQAEAETREHTAHEEDASISPHRFSSDASTASLCLQLHQCHEHIDRLERHNARFLRRFYAKVAMWCLVIMAGCWMVGGMANATK